MYNLHTSCSILQHWPGKSARQHYVDLKEAMYLLRKVTASYGNFCDTKKRGRERDRGKEKEMPSHYCYLSFID